MTINIPSVTFRKIALDRTNGSAGDFYIAKLVVSLLFSCHPKGGRFIILEAQNERQ